MCFHKNMGTHMCILMKTPKWQGNAIVFPALITMVLGNAYVLNMFFLCVSSRLKSVAVFLVQTHPNRCFSQKLYTFQGQKLRTRHAAGKTELASITKQIGKFNEKKIQKIELNLQNLKHNLT